MATVTIPSTTPRRGGFHFDPPLYHPSSVQTPGSSVDHTKPSHPFYRPPPNIRKVPVVGRHSPPAAIAEAIDTKQQDLEKVETVQKQARQVQLSDRFHIIGFNQNAKLLAHELATIPNLPPVAHYTHHTSISTAWGREGKEISIYNRRGDLISSREIRCPLSIFPRKVSSPVHFYEGTRNDYLDNVIVGTAPWSVIASLRAIRASIDSQTTICLLNEGLGLMERLNEKVFFDERVRPNYVLAHSTHKLARYGDKQKYSFKQMRQGRLVLHGVPRLGDPDAVQRTNHFVKLLSTTDFLGTAGMPWDKFLLQKLPSMIFTSLADTISVVMGCRYRQLHLEHHNRHLWDSLFEEIGNIISAFPELQNRPHVLQQIRSISFANKLKNRLARRGTEQSPWISWVRDGQMPPIEYFNGYFISRARELGVDHKINDTVMSMVKSRLRIRRAELKDDIPIGWSPRMMDSDAIVGQPAEENDEADFELVDDFKFESEIPSRYKVEKKG